MPALTAIRDASRSDRPAAGRSRTAPAKGLKSAAKQAFKWMSWDQLEAHRNAK